MHLQIVNFCKSKLEAVRNKQRVKNQNYFHKPMAVDNYNLLGRNYGESKTWEIKRKSSVINQQKVQRYE